MSRFRPTPELKARNPDAVLVRVVRPDREVVLALPCTAANRAKQLGPLPFDMLNSASIYPDGGSPIEGRVQSSAEMDFSYMDRK